MPPFYDRNSGNVFSIRVSVYVFEFILGCPLYDRKSGNVFSIRVSVYLFEFILGCPPL